MGELVSVIIPTYNRESLLKETLRSIISQSYSNWECIIVDDGSEDNTEEILKSYSKKDSRISFFFRPKRLPKGPNSCRNYGFQQSSGEYIIWFDSDDLMTQDHIECKIKALKKENVDFIVGRTQNFKGDEMLEPYTYEKKDYGIKASDFILLKIHWYTYDVILKRDIAEKIRWNEHMKSWQDYNYFCKMLLETENGAYLNKVLTYRRIHKYSIQKKLTGTKENFQKELLENRLLTFKDIQSQIAFKTRRELVFGMMNLAFENACSGNHSQYTEEVIKIVLNQLGGNSKFLFEFSILVASITGRGHYFLNKAKHR